MGICQPKQRKTIQNCVWVEIDTVGTTMMYKINQSSETSLTSTEFLLYLQLHMNIIVYSDDLRFLKEVLLKYIPCVLLKSLGKIMQVFIAFVLYN